ncbi:MAG: Uma2 family endonuclease [Thermosynechococcaceae cyanobacterium]
MIANLHPTAMSIEDYLAWEPQQAVRYEYVNGTVYAMTGGTIPHNDIAINLLTVLLPQVRAQGCRLNMADVKLQVNASGLYYYPDLIVSCDPRDLNALKFIQFPKLIVEVLSPGTADKDRSNKFRDYQSISTLQEYLLVNSETISAECYRRGEGRMWLYYPYTAGDAIALESLGCQIDIEQLYIGVNFEGQS